MMGIGGRLRLFALGIDAEEASFARRGFPDCAAREALEAGGKSFVAGYRAALEVPAEVASGGLDARVPAPMVGFAYEGAAMAFGLLDVLTQGRWFERFLAGPAQRHAYITHVGLGWSYARLPLGYRRRWRRLDPLLRWLAIDGLGFHEGYFHPERTIRRNRPRFRLEDYARRAFDQGVGRSLWFVTGADAAGIAQTIAAFAPERRGDLWSGVGLAAGYAGGVGRSELQSLRRLGSDHAAEIAQGVAFAAEARRRAGNLVEHTELAAHVLCDTSADAAAARAVRHRENLGADSDAQPAYERWRVRLQAGFSHHPKDRRCSAF